MPNRLPESLKDSTILPAPTNGNGDGDLVKPAASSAVISYPKPRIRWRDVLAPYVFISPFLVFFVVMFVAPSIYSFGLSFFRYKGYGDARFVGIDNYVSILTYHVFWTELANTTFYWLAHVIPLLIGAFLLAVLIRSKLIKGQSFFKPIIFLPNIISTVAAALVYQSLFSTRYGVINTLIGVQVPWLQDDDLTKWVVVFLLIWRNLGWWMIVYLAGLSSINPELEEAATVDGASAPQRLLYIVIPLMRNIFLLAFVIDAIGSFRLFVEPNVVVNRASGASPEVAPILNLLISNLNNGSFGSAAAVGWILFVIIIIVAAVQFRIFQKTGEEVND